MNDRELLEKLKKRIRVMSDASEQEVYDLIEAGRSELSIAGVQGSEKDPLYYQAIVLYCKGNFGYDDNTERFRQAFSSLRDAMSLSGDYTEAKNGTDQTGLV